MSVSPFRNLESLLEEAAASGTVGVWWGDLVGVRFARGADEQHYAASTIKLPLAIAALRRAARGEINLHAQVPIHNAFTSAHDGSRFSVDPDEDQDPGTWAALGRGTRSLFQLADHAIVHSGNLATNLLLEAVGLQEVNRVLDAAGCSGKTIFTRGIEDVPAREAGMSNTVTAADLAQVMSAVGRRDTAVGGAMVCAPVEAMLARSVQRTMIPAGLPLGTPLANKPGWVPGVNHDVALVRPNGRPPFVLSICTTTDLDQTQGDALVASITKAVWQVFAA